MSLTEKQEQFCTEYVTNGGNGAKAYQAAYGTHNKASAAASASRLLRIANVLQRIRQLQDEAAAPRIAGITEAKATLSDIMRDPDAPPAARIRAAESLIKSAGGYIRPVLRADDDGGLTVYGDDNSGPAIIMLPPIDPDPDDETANDDGNDDLKGWIRIE